MSDWKRCEVLFTHRKSRRAFDWHQNQWPWMTLKRAMTSYAFISAIAELLVPAEKYLLTHRRGRYARRTGCFKSRRRDNLSETRARAAGLSGELNFRCKTECWGQFGPRHCRQFVKRHLEAEGWGPVVPLWVDLFDLHDAMRAECWAVYCLQLLIVKSCYLVCVCYRLISAREILKVSKCGFDHLIVAPGLYFQSNLTFVAILFSFLKITLREPTETLTEYWNEVLYLPLTGISESHLYHLPFRSAVVLHVICCYFALSLHGASQCPF